MTQAKQKPVKAPKVYDYKRSWNYVLWLLGRKSYTKAQLREKLRKKEATPDVINQVIARLEELKFVNDEDFASMYVQSRYKRKGRIVLKQELSRKGVSENIIDETLGTLNTETQIENATALLHKHAWRFQKEDPRKNYAKAFAFLARRGFTADVVKSAMEKSELFQ